MCVRKRWLSILALALLLPGGLPAQTPATDEANQPSTGWRRFDQRTPSDPAPSPASLTSPAGTWITVRTDQVISSDRNQNGDGFTATLTQPLVANGFVLARRGQTVGGRVALAEKAPRGNGSSRLALELTELTLVDGRQIPIQTSLAEYAAGRSSGRDVTTVGTTAVLGAAIGAAAEGGLGAGVGAVAGAAAGTAGVLLTRGRPTIVNPEAQLTFRLVSPITVPTENSPAFQPVTQADYGQGNLQPRRVSASPPPPPYYFGPYYPGFYPRFYYRPRLFHSGPRARFGGGFRRR